MQIHESSYNGQHARKLRDLLRNSQQRKTMRRIAGWLCVLMLAGLVMSAMGCASKPPIPCEVLPVMPLPALTEPLPSVSYSERLSQSLLRWQSVLTDIQMTQKP